MNCRLHRWRLTLMEYSFEVIHREGRANVGPDALSRVNINEQIEDKSILMIKTRSKTQQNTPSTSSESYQPIENRSDYFCIEERRNIIFTTGEHEYLFFLIPKESGRMHKQMQHRL